MTDTTAIPAEALAAARTAIRARWPVQIAPNTATALARVALEAAASILRTEAAADQRADLVRRWREREWIDVAPAEVLHRLLGDMDECEHDVHGDPTACYRKVMTEFMNDFVERGWTPPDEPHSANEVG